MKIGNPMDVFRTGAPPAGAAASTTDPAGVRPRGATGPRAAGERSATVKLSARLATLKGSDGADGSFDAGRVEQMKAAIANGSFKVDAGAVADKLISSNLEALTRSKP